MSAKKPDPVPPRSIDPLVAPRAGTHDSVVQSDLAGLLNREEQFSFLLALVDSTLEGIIAHKLDGTIVWYNRGALELLGCDDAQMQAMPPFGWVAPDIRARAPERLGELTRDGRMMFVSAVCRCDGVRVPTQVSVRLVETSVGPMAITVIRDDSERVAAREALERRARHDPLTELMNRVYFDEELDAAVTSGRRLGEVFALAYIDLDGFKPVNDRFGHAVGDAVLAEVARRLVAAVRPQDSVARLGGDEFGVIIPRVSAQEELSSIANRLLDAIDAPMEVSGHSIAVRGSVGLSWFDPATDTSDSLMLRADRAMYSAKRDSRRRWRIDPAKPGTCEPPQAK